MFQHHTLIFSGSNAVRDIIGVDGVRNCSACSLRGVRSSGRADR